MATYMVILVDDEGNENWTYPTEIEASDKQDALNAICENVPRDTIKTVLTVQEYKNIINKKGFGRQHMLQRQANMQADQFQNSKDFFNNITNAAMQMAEQNENSENNQIISQNNDSITIKIDNAKCYGKSVKLHIDFPQFKTVSFEKIFKIQGVL